MRIRCVCPCHSCRREVEIDIAGENSRGVPLPKCACGTTLKRVYSPPAFRKLSEAEAVQLLGGMSKLIELAKKAAD